MKDVDGWQKKNRDKTRANQVRFRDRQRASLGKEKFVPMPAWLAKAKIKEHKKKWLENNQEKMEAARERWAENNAYKVLEKTRRYQAKKLSAVPGWARKEEMADFYAIAKALTKATGVRVEVDHIVPLQSEIVCGLHCEANLRVIPASINRAKRNFYWPDMPHRTIVR